MENERVSEKDCDERVRNMPTQKYDLNCAFSFSLCVTDCVKHKFKC